MYNTADEVFYKGKYYNNREMNCLFKMAIVMLLRIIIFILLEIKDKINQPHVGDGNLEVHFIFYFIFQIPIYIYISMSHPLSYLIK
jgi:hypothetical protein